MIMASYSRQYQWGAEELRQPTPDLLSDAMELAELDAQRIMAVDFVEKLKAHHEEFTVGGYYLYEDTTELFIGEYVTLCDDCADKACRQISTSIELGFCLLARENSRRAALAAKCLWSALGVYTGYVAYQDSLTFTADTELGYSGSYYYESLESCDGCGALLDDLIGVDGPDSEEEWGEWEWDIDQNGWIELSGWDAARMYALIYDFDWPGQPAGITDRVMRLVMHTSLPVKSAEELKLEKDAADQERLREADRDAERVLLEALEKGKQKPGKPCCKQS